MKIEKWMGIVMEENRKYFDKSYTEMSPENWPSERKHMLEYIEAIDKLTEVYNMENEAK